MTGETTFESGPGLSNWIALDPITGNGVLVTFGVGRRPRVGTGKGVSVEVGSGVALDSGTGVGIAWVGDSASGVEGDGVKVVGMGENVGTGEDVNTGGCGDVGIAVAGTQAVNIINRRKAVQYANRREVKGGRMTSL